MIRAGLLVGLIGAAAGGAVALDGAEPFARLALKAGAPALSLALTGDPLTEGRALSALGRHGEAAEAFRRAGPRASYNRAHALAWTGDYELALRSLKAVLARDPADVEAAEDMALIATLFEGIEGEILPGAEAAGRGADVDQPDSGFEQSVASDGAGAAEGAAPPRSTTLTQPALAEHGNMRREIERTAIVASRRWLATFPDEPALYLKAIIAAEQARRAAAGLAPPAPPDPS